MLFSYWRQRKIETGSYILNRNHDKTNVWRVCKFSFTDIQFPWILLAIQSRFTLPKAKAQASATRNKKKQQTSFNHQNVKTLQLSTNWISYKESNKTWYAKENDTFTRLCNMHQLQWCTYQLTMLITVKAHSMQKQIQYWQKTQLPCCCLWLMCLRWFFKSIWSS